MVATAGAYGATNGTTIAAIARASVATLTWIIVIAAAATTTIGASVLASNGYQRAA